MAAKLELVPATAGKRLGAAVLDWLAPVAVLVVTFAIGFAGITRTQSGGFIIYDTASLVLYGGIGLGLTLVYLLVLMSLEGRTGNTLGNRVMGLRSADKDGYAPGAGGVALRGLITGAGIILASLAAAAVIIFKWFDIAMLILGPLVLIGAVWAVLVVVSNTWDPNSRLRGWHDIVAKTLMFDVKSGRNPITSGGIQGPYSFAPLDLPPVQQVASPVAGAGRMNQAQVNQAQVNQAQVNRAQVNQAPVSPTPVHQPSATPAVLPYQGQPPLRPGAAQPPAPVQPYAPVTPALQQQQPVTHANPAQPYAATQPYTAPPSAFTPPLAPGYQAPNAHAAPVAQPGPSQPGSVQPAPAQAFQSQPAHSHPDDDHDRTQMRGGAAYAAPVAVLRIKLDDGRDFQLDRNVLVGRNPVGQTGEQQSQVLAIADPGRSISKTHLHLLTDGAGIWVTDRNSTNGSAVTTPDGQRTPLQPGVPAFVSPGSTVHFGDRSFHLGQA